jgi:hypothetical protein
MLIFLCCTQNVFAQHYDTVSVFNLPVQIDEVVIKTGWDIAAFVKRVQTDTTFYKAFRSMRLVPYSAINDIKVYGKSKEVMASLYSKTRQKINHGCRSMEVTEERTTGNFYKPGHKYNYYTADLYAHLFFTKDSVCGENNIVKGALDEKGKGKMEKSKYQLKQLIFNPGSKIAGVPMMGDKASVFDPDQARKYDFKITTDSYEGIDCYVFKVSPRKGEEKNVVYNELTTWFRKSDYSIVARFYSLSYHTVLYDFDVTMKVKTIQKGTQILPSEINYNGNWHVLTQKREKVIFNTIINY